MKTLLLSLFSFASLFWSCGSLSLSDHHADLNSQCVLLHRGSVSWCCLWVWWYTESHLPVAANPEVKIKQKGGWWLPLMILCSAYLKSFRISLLPDSHVVMLFFCLLPRQQQSYWFNWHLDTAMFSHLFGYLWLDLFLVNRTLRRTILLLFFQITDKM